LQFYSLFSHYRLPINQNIPTGNQAFEQYLETNSYSPEPPLTMHDVTEVFQMKDDTRTLSIEWQSCIRSACIFLADKKDSTSDDVLSISGKIYKFLQDKINGR
jgi:hypothetical protein